LSLLAVISGAIQATIVTLFWLLMKTKDLQVLKAEAREAEWKRVALRGVEDIIPSLASEVRARTREQLQGLREP
jgi:biopolymer transport protein ExbB/TolQ